MNRFKIARPFLHLLDPERAHHWTLWALTQGLVGNARRPPDPSLSQRLWGLQFPNPVGLAAGFDKNAVAVAPLLALGFGFVEVGSITPQPQTGNPKPRLFRLSEDKAVINRMGFNNDGMAAARRQLTAFRSKGAAQAGLVGINLGKNKTSPDAGEDYAAGATALAGLADYMVINVSSPNTPGLRALQDKETLALLVKQVRRAIQKLDLERTPPLLVKLAPDLTDKDKEEIAQVALEDGIDGLIISNTTITRPEGLKSPHRAEAGGLSGRPLFDLSTALVREFFQLTKGQIPLVAVGGIANGADAYQKLRAGASLVQLYSALVFQGPNLITRIQDDLAHFLARDGFQSIRQAVGADASVS
ncbi:MAG: quinone-dependent dihydroorotate dehydrogenase [Pseudomonadota bacterium]